jgi:hypothetical protein
VKDFKFLEAAKFIGTATKESHTVIEKWPFRLKLRPGQPGAQEEFNRLLGGGGIRKGALCGVEENLIVYGTVLYCRRSKPDRLLLRFQSSAIVGALNSGSIELTLLAAAKL